MNPRQVNHYPRPTFQDVMPQPQNQVDSDLKPAIVNGIPLKMPDNLGNAKISEDADLDKIMNDVDREMKAAESKRSKRSWFSFKKEKQEVPTSATEVPALNATQTTPHHPLAPSRVPAAIPQEPKKAPLTIAITLAVLVTVGLLTAAYYAYK